ncbi:head-tail connector protein [Microvirga pudoricolor]|uniref:head-tail connector protein n=1 Tax=Microvirga pudoricolor TaxID=2778729 RepID=UPI00195285DB|nr:hypothetical protein [Microvirga pudoricolor]MBM6592379.1 hypothetical protein [Microvirga pudoricolor]
MNPILIGGPAVEPVSLADMKAHLRVDGEDENELIAGLVKAGRLMVESASRRLLIEQAWRVTLDAWPLDGVLSLPVSPVIALDAVRVAGEGGAMVDVDPGAVEADLLSDPPQVIVRGAPRPARPRNGIALDLRGGYGASAHDVPATLALAVKLVVAHWFEHRGDMEGLQTLPADALALIAPFQRIRM